MIMVSLRWYLGCLTVEFTGAGSDFLLDICVFSILFASGILKEDPESSMKWGKPRLADPRRIATKMDMIYILG